MDFNTLTEFIRQINYFNYFFLLMTGSLFNIFEHRLCNDDLCDGSTVI